MEQEELYNHCMKSDNPNSILAEPLLDTEVTKEKSKDNRKILGLRQSWINIYI